MIKLGSCLIAVAFLAPRPVSDSTRYLACSLSIRHWQKVGKLSLSTWITFVCYVCLSIIVLGYCHELLALIHLKNILILITVLTLWKMSIETVSNVQYRYFDIFVNTILGYIYSLILQIQCKHLEQQYCRPDRLHV